MNRRLTSSECAAILRVSEKTIDRLREKGELPYMPGRPVTIAEQDLAGYIERKTCRAQTSDRILRQARTASGTFRSPAEADRAAALRAQRIVAKLKGS